MNTFVEIILYKAILHFASKRSQGQGNKILFHLEAWFCGNNKICLPSYIVGEQYKSMYLTSFYITTEEKSLKLIFTQN